MPIVREPLDPRSSLWHWLAFQLRYLREAHELSLTQVGSIIGAARSTVSNIEAGRLRIDDKQAHRLDQHYETGFLIQLLLYYARLGHDPEWFRQFASYEAQAEAIRIYSGLAIPGPFQTEGYTRALLAESRQPDIEGEVAARMARQAAILDRERPPWVWVLIEEGAIELVIGGPSIMHDQLEHLVKMNSLPNASVRLIPKTAGTHAGMDGTFRTISMASREVAYAGAKLGGRLIEEPAEVGQLRVDFERIGLKALSEAESTARIRRQIAMVRP